MRHPPSPMEDLVKLVGFVSSHHARGVTYFTHQTAWEINPLSVSHGRCCLQYPWGFHWEDRWSFFRSNTLSNVGRQILEGDHIADLDSKESGFDDMKRAGFWTSVSDHLLMFPLTQPVKGVLLEMLCVGTKPYQASLLLLLIPTVNVWSAIFWVGTACTCKRHEDYP